MSKKLPSEEPPQFENALSDLEQIVRRLEQGGSSLEDDLGDYERAVKLIKLCHSRLSEAEKSVQLLSGVSSDGTPIAEPFEPSSDNKEESGLHAKQIERSRRRSTRHDDL